jgi:hypothetical protein
MKTVIATALLAVAVMASPALARTAAHNGSHHASPAAQDRSVYQGGVYLGSDPDPQVQFDLEREFNSRHGGY